jgi:transcriptional regulator with XRE-family HTH domain
VKLDDWRNSNGLTLSKLGGRIGVTKAYAGRLVKGEADPSGEVIRRIYAATGGQVTPNDIYGLYEVASGAEPAPASTPSVSSLITNSPAGDAKASAGLLGEAA